MESFFKDFKHSLRMFRQTPGFTATVIATLALGIGVTAAIFSVVNAVLLRPISAPQPDRVVALVSTNKEGSGSIASEIKFNLCRQQASLLEDLSGYYVNSMVLTGVDLPQRAESISVTQDYFRLFGLSIAQGRTFTEADEQPNGAHVVVLSHAFWKRVFGGDARILGKSISLSGTRYEVIGIMPTGVQTETPEPIDVWFPFPIDPNSTFQAHYFQAAARLKPGATLDMANAQLQLTTQAFWRKFPNTLSTNRRDVLSVAPLKNVLAQDSRSPLLILAGAVTLVLLIACANVANLLLVRAAGRAHEIAIRLAVGASRARIIRQLLTESVLLSLTGGLFGLIAGIFSIRALLTLHAARLPRLGVNESSAIMDWRVLAFTAAAALLTGILFGLVPAIQASRTDLNSRLKESSIRTGTGFRESKLRSLLVISEMSLALLLLIGSGLLIRSLAALRSVNPGFDPRNVITARTLLDPRSARTSGVDQIVEDTLRQLRALPGVENAGYTQLLPLEGSFNSIPIIVAGRPLNGPSHGSSRWVVVSASYFRVLEIPLVHGRLFTDADRLGSPPVAIINQTMARRLWPESDPLNARLFIGKGLGPGFAEPARQIVGVVGDVHDEALNEPPRPAVFVPGAQLPDTRMAGREVAWIVRTRAQSPSLNSAILNELRRATGQPAPPVRSMEAVLRQSTSREELNMLLMSVFGGSALLLAAIGIYGLLAYSVQQRTQEMGVRAALGAQARDVRNMVVFQGMRLAVIGAAIGVAAAFGLTRALASLLFGVQTLDPLIFVLAPIVLGGIALLAVWLPAYRASRVDPVLALRHE